nr:complement C1q tumor necrosis factor-related protein 3-like isoform X2 [Crassostrea virginica]
MDLKLKPLALAFICVVVIGFGDTAQQNSNNFLSSYDVQECVCQKMGWEPKCSKQPIKACPGKVIAFHAVLSNHLRNVPTSTIIKFDRVDLNDGNGYDPNTGKFTAPVDGVYYFLWTFSINKGTIAYLCGTVDGTCRSHVATYDLASKAEQISGHLVTRMKKGNRFWIQTFWKTVQFLHNNYSFLSGYKVSGC